MTQQEVSDEKRFLNSVLHNIAAKNTSLIAQDIQAAIEGHKAQEDDEDDKDEVVRRLSFSSADCMEVATECGTVGKLEADQTNKSFATAGNDCKSTTIKKKKEEREGIRSEGRDEECEKKRGTPGKGKALTDEKKEKKSGEKAIERKCKKTGEINENAMSNDENAMSNDENAMSNDENAMSNDEKAMSNREKDEKKARNEIVKITIENKKVSREAGCGKDESGSADERRMSGAEGRYKVNITFERSGEWEEASQSKGWKGKEGSGIELVDQEESLHECEINGIKEEIEGSFDEYEMCTCDQKTDERDMEEQQKCLQIMQVKCLEEQTKTPMTSQMKTPMTSQMRTPMTTQMKTPMTTQMITPMTTQMITPMTTQMKTPMTTQMKTPMTTQMITPMTTQMKTPMTTQMKTPMTQMKTPMTTQMETPMTTQMKTPMTTQMETPMTTQMKTPMTTQMITPMTTQMKTPMTTQMKTPMTQMKTPMTTQMETPMTTQMKTPMTTQMRTPMTQMKTPMTSQMKTPMTTQIKTPMTTQMRTPMTQMKTPMTSQMKTPMTTQMKTPMTTQMKTPMTQMKTPMTTQMKTPMTTQMKTPMTQMKTPMTTQMKTPMTTQMKTPMKTQMRTPMTQMKTPMTTQMKTPMTSQMRTPMTSQMKTPMTTQMKTPMTQMKTPMTTQMKTPMTSQMKTPMTTQMKTPMTTQIKTPMTTQMKTPMTTQMKTPMTSQMKTPMTSQMKTPMTSQTEIQPAGLQEYQTEVHSAGFSTFSGCVTEGSVGNERTDKHSPMVPVCFSFEQLFRKSESNEEAKVNGELNFNIYEPAEPVRKVCAKDLRHESPVTNFPIRHYPFFKLNTQPLQTYVSSTKQPAVNSPSLFLPEVISNINGHFFQTQDVNMTYSCDPSDQMYSNYDNHSNAYETNEIERYEENEKEEDSRYSVSLHYSGTPYLQEARVYSSQSFLPVSNIHAHHQYENFLRHEVHPSSNFTDVRSFMFTENPDALPCQLNQNENHNVVRKCGSKPEEKFKSQKGSSKDEGNMGWSREKRGGRLGVKEGGERNVKKDDCDLSELQQKVNVEMKEWKRQPRKKSPVHRSSIEKRPQSGADVRACLINRSAGNERLNKEKDFKFTPTRMSAQSDKVSASESRMMHLSVAHTKNSNIYPAQEKRITAGRERKFVEEERERRVEKKRVKERERRIGKTGLMNSEMSSKSLGPKLLESSESGFALKVLSRKIQKPQQRCKKGHHTIENNHNLTETKPEHGRKEGDPNGSTAAITTSLLHPPHDLEALNTSLPHTTQHALTQTAVSKIKQRSVKTATKNGQICHKVAKKIQCDFPPQIKPRSKTRPVIPLTSQASNTLPRLRLPQRLSFQWRVASSPSPRGHRGTRSLVRELKRKFEKVSEKSQKNEASFQSTKKNQNHSLNEPFSEACAFAPRTDGHSSKQDQKTADEVSILRQTTTQLSPLHSHLPSHSTVAIQGYCSPNARSHFRPPPKCVHSSIGKIIPSFPALFTSSPANLPYSSVYPSTDANFQNYNNYNNQPINNHNPPINNHHLPINNHNPPINNHHLPINNHNPPINNHDLPINNHNPPINNHHLPINNHNPPINNHHLPINNHNPPINNHDLLINNHDLPINNNDPPINNHHLPINNHNPPINNHDLLINNYKPPVDNYNDLLINNYNNPPINNHDPPVDNYNSQAIVFPWPVPPPSTSCNFELPLQNDYPLINYFKHPSMPLENFTGTVQHLPT